MKITNTILHLFILGLPAIAAGSSQAGENVISGHEPIQIHCSDVAYAGPSRVIHPETYIAVDPVTGKIAWEQTDSETGASSTSGILGPEMQYENNSKVQVSHSGDSVVITGSAFIPSRVPNSQNAHIVLLKTDQDFQGPQGGQPVYFLQSFEFQNWNYFNGPEQNAPVHQLANQSNHYCAVSGI